MSLLLPIRQPRTVASENSETRFQRFALGSPVRIRSLSDQMPLLRTDSRRRRADGLGREGTLKGMRFVQGVDRAGFGCGFPWLIETVRKETPRAATG